MPASRRREPSSKELRTWRYSDTEEFEADIVSMGKLGLDADERGFVGSTTERVLRKSNLPVLSVE